MHVLCQCPTLFELIGRRADITIAILLAYFPVIQLHLNDEPCSKCSDKQACSQPAKPAPPAATSMPTLVRVLFPAGSCHNSVVLDEVVLVAQSNIQPDTIMG